MNEKSSGYPLYSLGLVSAAALADEVLLIRLFSIIQWHHFAYMIISLALLGYGVSGTFLSLVQTRLLAHFSAAYFVNLLLFGISVPLCYWFAQRISFNPEEMLWDLSLLTDLFWIYLLLMLPFFFAANSIGLALSHYHQRASRLYAADLIGAGFGSLGIILLLFWLFPISALEIIGALGILAALLACWELKLKRWAWSVALMSGILLMLIPVSWIELRISPYKSLNQFLQVSGAHIIGQYSSPLALLTVVESPRIPIRHAPGLSLNATREPPEQLAVFTDADAMTAITHYDGDKGPLAYLDQLTWALPYHLKKIRRVLILGAGGGGDVLQALYHDVQAIDAVELNPQLVELVKRTYADFAGHFYADDKVNIHVAEARGFVQQTAQRYDLMQLALLDSFSASSAGLYALNESYLYTAQALQEYIQKLTPDGYLALTRWVKMPPRDTLKLFATAVEALRRLGIDRPEQRLILIRGWQTSTLLIKNGPVTGQEIAEVRRFCERRSFDVAYYPGIEPGEANRFNVLRQAYFYEGAQALLGNEAEQFYKHYKFNLRPATDDRPYFFHFFKWSTLPEILKLRGRGGRSLLESGYLVLIATLLQAIVASLVLILVPLTFRPTTSVNLQETPLHWRIFIYFFSLGLAFLFIEIAFIQKFILFLYHPLYAMTVVLTAFLAFAGLGSLYSARIRLLEITGVSLPIAVIILLGMLYILGIENVFKLFRSTPDWLKIALAIIMIAPLGFFMGMPFPIGLKRLGLQAPSLIPWAWGINGCASVLSAVLATVIAIQFGFSVLLVLALLLYAIAAFYFPWKS